MKSLTDLHLTANELLEVPENIGNLFSSQLGTWWGCFKYYLIHEKERFIIFKTRGAAERFIYDKTRLFECIKGLQIRRIVMLNRMQHYIKNTNERDRLYKVSS